MQLEITFPGEDRVDARFDGLTIETDQSGAAPAPFDLFLASIGTCAGIYVARFCRQRDIDPGEVRIVQTADKDPETGLVGRIDLEILLPEGFPERYRNAVVRAADLCTVKKHLHRPPEIVVRTVMSASAAS